MKHFFIPCFIFFSSFFVQAQKLKVKQGDFDFLGSQKEINVEFTFDKLTLFKDQRSEAEYVRANAAKLDDESRGKGQAWEKKWNSSKENIWIPKFLELMNRYLYEKENLYFGTELRDATYTLIVDTRWIYPGWDAGIMKQEAKVTTSLKFVESNNRDNIILSISSSNAPGDQWGSSFDTEDRIGEGYAKTGKSVAKLIQKEVV